MKNPNRITPEQDRRYKELAEKGLALAQAIRQAQQEFGLPEPHSRQAVSQRKYGFARGRRGVMPAAADLSAEDILAFITQGIEARKVLPGLKRELAECRQEIARLKGELAKREVEPRRMEELKQRIKKAGT